MADEAVPETTAEAESDPSDKHAQKLATEIDQEITTGTMEVNQLEEAGADDGKEIVVTDEQNMEKTDGENDADGTLEQPVIQELPSPDVEHEFPEDDPDHPIIKCSLGKLRGHKWNTPYNDEYFGFEKIPYAQPPVKKLRFLAPVPAEPWSGILDCGECGPVPMQYSPVLQKVIGSEDCLYLNIYAKTLTSAEPLPVLVWIYGGSFETGGASRDRFGPDFFMLESVVLVTFNYRLGSLGFLSFVDPLLEIPGNSGLKDQLLALKWLQENIASFNGDQNNITLFGESAGAVCVHYLAASPLAEGLFQKAILMSGTMLNNWAIQPSLDFAYRLACSHGYIGGNTELRVLAFLRCLEGEKLVEHSLITMEEMERDIFFPFAPIVEHYETQTTIVAKAPMEMLKIAWSNKIPMIFGGTSCEGMFIYPYLETFERKSLHVFLPYTDMRHNRKPREINSFLKRIMNIHFDNQEDTDFAKGVIELFSIRLFWHAVHRSTQQRLTSGAAPTYLYKFDFEADGYTVFRQLHGNPSNISGVAHADDLCYLFRTTATPLPEPNGTEYLTMRRMIGAFCAFARSSNPNCELLKPLEWLPMSKDRFGYALIFDRDMNFRPLQMTNKLAAWDEVCKLASKREVGFAKETETRTIIKKKSTFLV